MMIDVYFYRHRAIYIDVEREREMRERERERQMRERESLVWLIYTRMCQSDPVIQGSEL